MECWYAVQVRTGGEEGVARLCRKLVGHEVMAECFIPKYERKRRYEGAWHTEQEILFPGYLFFVTRDAERLHEELKRVPGMTKILGDGEEFIPLQEEEMERLRSMGNEDHVIEMSEGYIVGDEVVITKGPMMKLKGTIQKIDRHKRLAVVRLGMFGREVDVTMGVEIVRKVQKE